MARNDGLDIARGAMMFYIVAVIHGMFFLKPQGYEKYSVLLFEMPVMFFISGYAAGISKNKDVFSFHSYADFLKKRARRILVPYFAYTTVYSWIAAYYEKGLSLHDWLSWVNPFSFGNGTATELDLLRAHLWFVRAFLLTTMVVPFFKVLDRVKINLTYSFLALVLLIAALDPHKKLITQQIIVFSGFTYLGHRYFRCPPTQREQIILLISAVSAVLALIAIGYSMDMQANKFPPNAIYFAYGTICVLILFNIFQFAPPPPTIARSLLVPFVRYGYSIYLWQGIPFFLVNRYLSGLHFFVAMAVILAGTLFLAKIASRIE